MARRTENLRRGKEFFEHFTPKEMATIAACVVCPYQELSTYQENNLAGMKRPWPIYDRIINALRLIVAAFEKQSIGKATISFAVAEYNKGMQTVSSEVPLLPEEVKRSGEIWAALLDWSSTGKDKEIKKFIDEFDGAKRCEALGFKKQVFAPFAVEEINGGIDALSIDEIGKTSSEPVEEKNPDDFAPSATLIPRRRGRPSKQPVAAE